MRRTDFGRVEAVGRTLPDVELTTSWGQPTLKVRGRMFVCMAANKSAEPHTLVVMMDFADRDALIGSTLRVLVDECGVARSHHEAPEIDGVVHVPESLTVGEFHDVEIVNALGPDLIAAGAAEVG